jgi:hypothetical protein
MHFEYTKIDQELDFGRFDMVYKNMLFWVVCNFYNNIHDHYYSIYNQNTLVKMYIQQSIHIVKDQFDALISWIGFELKMNN